MHENNISNITSIMLLHYILLLNDVTMPYNVTIYMTINRTHNYNHDCLNINIDINTHYPNHTLPWEKLNAFMVANVSNKIR